MLIRKLSKYFFSKNSILLQVGLVFFVVAGIINNNNIRPEIRLSKQDTALNINKNIYLFMNAGNKRLFTDLLWIQTLIESDLDRYKGRDLNSWMFIRFNAISILDPYFYENYLYGGQFLAIVKDDLEGADKLYEKATAIYPDDYRLNYNAGFLNYYEIGNPEKGLRYLKKIESHPKAPLFLKSIIHKLLVDSGASLEVVFKLVQFNYETTKDEKFKQRLAKDLYAIRAEIDLNCLNQQGHDCNLKDLLGNLYQMKNGRYISTIPYRPYRIKKRSDVK